MSLGKQAKILSRAQIDGALGYIARTRHPHRNRVIFLLSVRAGFRAKEIASLRWDMVTGSDGEIGDAIHLRNSASKGRSGRVILSIKNYDGRWWSCELRSRAVVPRHS